MWKKFELYLILKIVLVRKGRTFYATLYQEVFFFNRGGGEGGPESIPFVCCISWLDLIIVHFFIQFSSFNYFDLIWNYPYLNLHVEGGEEVAAWTQTLRGIHEGDIPLYYQ